MLVLYRCGHCKRLAPTWTELADLVKREQEGWGNLSVARVHATEQRDNPGTPFVKGFPTLLFLVGGKV